MAAFASRADRRSSGKASGASVTALHGEVWKTADFLEIEAAIGSTKALRLLRDFLDRLDHAFYSLRLDSPTGEQVNMLAHDLKGISGQLGFQALAHFCSRIMVSGQMKPTPAQLGIWVDLIRSSIQAAETYCAVRPSIGSAMTR